MPCLSVVKPRCDALADNTAVVSLMRVSDLGLARHVHSHGPARCSLLAARCASPFTCYGAAAAPCPQPRSLCGHLPLPRWHARRTRPCTCLLHVHSCQDLVMLFRARTTVRSSSLQAHSLAQRAPAVPVGGKPALDLLDAVQQHQGAGHNPLVWVLAAVDAKVDDALRLAPREEHLQPRRCVRTSSSALLFIAGTHAAPRWRLILRT